MKFDHFINRSQFSHIGGSNFHSMRNNKKYGSTLAKIINELVKLVSDDDSVNSLCRYAFKIHYDE